MRKVIEYTLLSADGVFEDPARLGFMQYRDDAYLRDGLGLLSACEAMLMGRNTYESLAKIWPSRTDPWARRLNAMKKYVFSSTLKEATWSNAAIVRGDVAVEVTRLKEEQGGDLLVWGHGLFSETLLQQRLIDVLDLSFHPLVVGRGKGLFREGQQVKLRLVVTKSFSHIVKLTYEPLYELPASR
jgi:dihydrofolate reductase